MLGRTWHRLIAGLAQNAGYQLVLECIGTAVRVLSADISTAVNLIQIVVGRWPITDQPLDLIRQLVVDGKGDVLRRIGYKISNQGRRWLNTILKNHCG